MSMGTYTDALEIAEYLGDTSISIGGGEPTVHPNFWEMVRRALTYNDENNVWLATNGKRKADALVLAALNRGWDWIYDTLGNDDKLFNAIKGATNENDWDRFSCELSLDAYHAPIDPHVVAQFKNLGSKFNHYEYIRDVTYNVANVGRAELTGVGTTDECACATLCVHSKGDLALCGCPDAESAGTVREPDYDLIYKFNEEGGFDGKGCASQRKGSWEC